MGLSHLLGHQIGPRWNVPHGITSCITLPNAMRFMAEIAAERFGPIAEGYGIPFDPSNPKPAALKCADRTEEFIVQFDVPRTLRDAGVPHEEIGDIVGPITHELQHMSVVDRPMTEQEVLALLEAAIERDPWRRGGHVARARSCLRLPPASCWCTCTRPALRLFRRRTVLSGVQPAFGLGLRRPAAADRAGHLVLAIGSGAVAGGDPFVAGAWLGRRKWCLRR